MVQSALVASIAVLGTLLGATLAHLLQKRHTTYLNVIAAGERLREERITAYSAFAGCVADLRGAQLRRWTTRREYDAENDEYAQARSDSWRMRTVARGAMYRVQLIADNADLARRAYELVQMTIDILDASDADDLAARTKRSAAETSTFVAEARSKLSKI